MAKSALIIGSFTATETGFKGKIQTLAINANVTFTRVPEKGKDTHPDFYVTADSNGYEIGAAWQYKDDRGPYVSFVPDEPSLAPGSYKLVKSGVEKGYTLTYRKPMLKKDGKK